MGGLFFSICSLAVRASVCKKYTHDAKISLLLAGLGWNQRGFLTLYASAPNSDTAQ
jgi:hypothetical protein